MTTGIEYSTGHAITAEQFVDVLRRSTLAERRPVDDPETIAAMLRNADLMVTAWRAGELIGVARSITDYSYCCYLSDLAVDASVQRAGVGRELVRLTREQLGPRCLLILLSAPAAVDYYPRIGFEQHPSAWVLGSDHDLR
jgi:predicted N-acetyltransferase YhbS